jgi:hypothetical protein
MRHRRKPVVAAQLLALCFWGCARDARPDAAVSECPGALHAARAARDAAGHTTPRDEVTLGVDECPEAIQNEYASGLATYNRFVERALDLPPGPDVLLAIRISPSFEPDRALSLRRTATGAYVLRSTRLVQNVWSRMMDNMRRQQGDVIHLDEGRQADALREMRMTREIRERFVDPSTADLLLTLWTAALRREQAPNTSDSVVVTLDGTSYRLWAEAGAVSIPNPRGTLGLAMSGTHHLERIVDQPSSEDCALLQAAVAEMADALYRIRHAGPCMRRALRLEQ